MSNNPSDKYSFQAFLAKAAEMRARDSVSGGPINLHNAKEGEANNINDIKKWESVAERAGGDVDGKFSGDQRADERSNQGSRIDGRHSDGDGIEARNDGIEASGQNAEASQKPSPWAASLRKVERSELADGGAARDENAKEGNSQGRGAQDNKHYNDQDNAQSNECRDAGRETGVKSEAGGAVLAARMAAIEETRFDPTARENKTGASTKNSPDKTSLELSASREKGKSVSAVTHRPRLIGICNQKGGVGKTTTAVNLATALAAVGQRVLIIDMDPQGNASTGLGVRRSAIRTSVYDVLFEGADAVEAAVATRVPNLFVVPSSIHLSGAEIELVTAENREYRLKNALHRSLPYDYVIVDCPPSLNLLTLNTLVAVDSILVPLQCEFYALEGLSHLVKTIERVQKSFNPALDIHGIILTMYDLRNKLSAQVEADVREHFGDKVYKTVIPRNVRLSEAPSYGLPAIVYDMKSTGAQAYIKLAREVILRERKLKAANSGGDEGSAQVA